MQLPVIVLVLLLGLPVACAWAEPEHVTTRDFPIVDDAFTHGYTHCLVTDQVAGKSYPTLAIQCVSNGAHHPYTDDHSTFFSAWARDLYWGFLGWTQAADDSALPRLKSSILELIDCKNRNKADGHNKTWPLNDGRFYIPQAFTKGGVIAETFFPYCSESQADFLLLTHLYWKMTGDKQFIRGIWTDIAYVTKTIELMDTNGNSLPDNLWGSYDYQGMGQDTEEALMSAKAGAAYRAVAEMAKSLGNKAEYTRLNNLSKRVKKTMNLSISRGGLWNPLPDGGYYVNRRTITKGKESVDHAFIPYENLVPMFFGIPSSKQSKAIFARLNRSFSKYYDLTWGPMYIAPAAKNENSVMDCSSAPWLGFLDVYLRCKLVIPPPSEGGGHPLVIPPPLGRGLGGGHPAGSEIMRLLINHAHDVPAAPFTEGAGIFGYLTNNSGRSWDNGNFFHCLINGVYGIRKSASGVTISAPRKLTGFPLTELKNVRWRNATYNFTWEGAGDSIASISVNGKTRRHASGSYLLSARSGKQDVVIRLAAP